MASPGRNLLAGSGAAALMAILLATPTVLGISSWKIFLGALGLILFVLSNSTGAETK